tara:strand:- start:1116 stop:1715 length:600 start_codon:yes stop_codon:yes gene_type:complete
MITEQQFEVQFNKLQAAFGVVKSAKIMDAWYDEFQGVDYSQFVSAMKTLQYGEKFPTWSVFKAELRNAQGMTTQEAFRGCGDCHSGVVLFRDVNKNGEVTDQASNCAECSQNKKKDMANVYPSKLHKDAVGILRTHRALKQERSKGVRIEEPAIDVSYEQPNIKQVVTKIYGSEDQANERKRYGSLKREEEREAKANYE